MNDDRDDDREIDEVLLEYLGDDLLRVMLEPPRVPTFAAETLAPRPS